MDEFDEFDYSLLDTATRTFIVERLFEIRSLMNGTAQDISEIGNKLIEIKDRLPHGAFGKWLKYEFGKRGYIDGSTSAF